MKMKDLKHELSISLGMYHRRYRKYQRNNELEKLERLEVEFKGVNLLNDALWRRLFRNGKAPNVYYLASKSNTLNECVDNLFKYLSKI